MVCWLGLALAVPYALAHGIAPLVLASPAQRNLLARRVYPALLLAALLAALAGLQVKLLTCIIRTKNLLIFNTNFVKLLMLQKREDILQIISNVYQ